MRKDIKVSFMDDPEEDQLYDDIIKQSKITFLGQARWMKLAAREKLERDFSSKSDSKVPKMSADNQGGIINSLDDLFSK